MRLSEDAVKRQKKLCGCCAAVDNTLRLRGFKHVCTFRRLRYVCKFRAKPLTHPPRLFFNELYAKAACHSSVRGSHLTKTPGHVTDIPSSPFCNVGERESTFFYA